MRSIRGAWLSKEDSAACRCRCMLAASYCEIAVLVIVVVEMNKPDELEHAVVDGTNSNQSSGSVSSLQGEEEKPRVEVMEPEYADRNDNKEYFCGFGKCKPKWMQRFRDSKIFTFILCLNCCIEGALVSGKCNCLAS